MLSRVELEVLNLWLDSRQDTKLIALLNKAVMFAKKMKHVSVTLDHLIYTVLNEIEEESNYWYPYDKCRKEIMAVLRKEVYLKWIQERGEEKGNTTYASISIIDLLKLSYNEKNLSGKKIKLSTLDIFKRIINVSFINTSIEIPELFLHCSGVGKIEEILNQKMEPKMEDKMEDTMPKQSYMPEVKNNLEKHENIGKVIFDVVGSQRTIPEYLEEMEKQFSKNGTKLTFTKDAINLITAICGDKEDTLNLLADVLINPILEILNDNTINFKLTKIIVKEKNGKISFLRKSKSIINA